MDPYLLGLRLEGRRVVVVGGGAVASRRVPALLDAGADVLLVSPKVAASLEDLAAAGRVSWEARGYRPGDCAVAWTGTSPIRPIPSASWRRSAASSTPPWPGSSSARPPCGCR